MPRSFKSLTIVHKVSWSIYFWQWCEWYSSLLCGEAKLKALLTKKTFYLTESPTVTILQQQTWWVKIWVTSKRNKHKNKVEDQTTQYLLCMAFIFSSRGTMIVRGKKVVQSMWESTYIEICKFIYCRYVSHATYCYKKKYFSAANLQHWEEYSFLTEREMRLSVSL